MKYDELYKQIEGLWHDSYKAPGYAILWNIVKLHKPFDFKMGDEIFTSCEGCGSADYPCRTIEIIEKELS